MNTPPAAAPTAAAPELAAAACSDGSASADPVGLVASAELFIGYLLVVAALKNGGQYVTNPWGAFNA